MSYEVIYSAGPEKETQDRLGLKLIFIDTEIRSSV